MPQKQEFLDRVLADEPKTSSPRNRRLMPVAAAASIALVAGGVLAVPALTKSGNEGVAPADRTRTEQIDGLRVRRGIPIDLGPLTQAQASQLAKECAKWIGSKDLGGGREYPLDWPGAGAGAGVDAALHAVVVRSGWEPNSSDWTVAIKSGGQIYACVGHPTRKGPTRSTIQAPTERRTSSAERSPRASPPTTRPATSS
jgi:hypothetical protein